MIAQANVCSRQNNTCIVFLIPPQHGDGLGSKSRRIRDWITSSQGRPAAFINRLLHVILKIPIRQSPCDDRVFLKLVFAGNDKSGSIFQARFSAGLRASPSRSTSEIIMAVARRCLRPHHPCRFPFPLATPHSPCGRVLNIKPFSIWRIGNDLQQ